MTQSQEACWPCESKSECSIRQFRGASNRSGGVLAGKELLSNARLKRRAHRMIEEHYPLVSEATRRKPPAATLEPPVKSMSYRHGFRVIV